MGTNFFKLFYALPRRVRIFSNIRRYNYFNQFPLKVIRFGQVPLFITSLVSIRFAAVLFEKRKESLVPDQKQITKILTEVDGLYDSSQYQKIIDILQLLQSLGNDEVLWRLGRALYKQGQEHPKGSPESKSLTTDAYECLKLALEANENNYNIHRWMSIVLDKVSSNKGTKEVIEQSYVIKHHMQKAIELNPKDATSYFLLGYWCYAVAELPWYQRKIAAAIFAAPPTSSFEEALQYFNQAEQMDPYFYSKNLLMIGKTYWQLGDNENAKIFAKKAKDYVPKNREDREVHDDATNLLKKLGVI